MNLTELILNWLYERGYKEYVFKCRSVGVYYVAPVRGPAYKPTSGRFIQFIDESVRLYRNPPPENIDIITLWAGDVKLFERLEAYFPRKL